MARTPINPDPSPDSKPTWWPDALQRVAICVFSIYLVIALWFGLKGVSDLRVPPADKTILEPPKFDSMRRIDSPLAILVLDLSGSMNRNDPDRLQAEAVRNFLRLYQTMVADTLKHGESARVAVVLFGTAAQTLLWPPASGADPRFLNIPKDPAELDRLADQSIMPYLSGSGNIDPRAGENTDYYAAVHEIESLMQAPGIVSPPCVLFMTDGADNPFFDFSATSQSDRERLAREFAEGVTAAISKDYADRPDLVKLAQTAAGRLTTSTATPLHGVSQGSLLWDPMKDYVRELGPTLRGYAQKRPTPSRAGAASRLGAIQKAVAALSARQFGVAGVESAKAKAPMVWNFLYLGKDREGLAPLRSLAAPLASAADHWGLPNGGVVHCQGANQLQLSFLETLGGWLSLDSAPLAAGASTFTVDPKTAGLGVVVDADSATGVVVLESPGGTRHTLQASGSSGGLSTWFGSLGKPEAGIWKIRAGAGIRGGKVWARQRYVWAFCDLPRHYSPLMGSREVFLRVYDTESHESTNAVAIYEPSSLPPTVGADLIMPDGTHRPFSMEARKDASGAFTGFAGALPPATGVQQGMGKAIARIRGLTYLGSSTPLPERTMEAKLTFSVLDFQLQSREGAPCGGIILKHVLPGMEGGSR